MLDWEEFSKHLSQMKSLSDELLDGWAILGKTGTENGAYLAKKVPRLFEEALLLFEYNVVYDLSYGVPKLCFNVFRTDGSMLQLNECIHVLGFDGEPVLVLTQMDHPVLQRPFFTLHPCKTSEFMDFCSNSKNPLVSWLSAIGPTVGLNLANEYSQCT
ncbi:PREDICTED: ubiquitin-like-conjugating enzyme ATG10 [Nicrophorus vespilloides]|uniref:Ubiquitin-like-conjugating enzyme ATG10 n=1 Tax=Nicrophorus vespilloides TaxID=110193 RepID=A0ABM1MAA7_NICVS|nr:PREDICTED: ubiquitin-like-conjugating enzyme ATG10 [Nicrophorus vespilloides]XP_017771508.1 PREDICTED: ubiquitin-like-conjugating enzyme ATG10 [Nicrophorus vespilloides]